MSINEQRPSNELQPHIVVEPDAIPALLGYLVDHSHHRLALVADDNTFAALGRRVLQDLTSRGMDVRLIVLEGAEVVPDERFIMQVLMPMGDEERTYLAVGSGVITDIVRFVSHRTRANFISLPTAPSVDGYTSISASMVLNRLKVTVPAHAPQAIFADLDTLRAAPRPMIAAGFGDVLAKYTAVADWNLGYLLWDTPYDAAVAQRTARARDACVEQVEQIAEATPAGISALFYALVETGLCMVAVDASYPAAGSEHYVSHYWEMKLLQENRPAILHGAKVGVGTILMAEIYARIRELDRDQAAARLAVTPLPDRLQDEARVHAAYWDIGDQIIAEQAPFLTMTPREYAQLKARVLDVWSDIQATAAQVPSPAAMAMGLHQVGGPTSARELGFSDQEEVQALQVSHFLRNRFTVCKLARMLGLLS